MIVRMHESNLGKYTVPTDDGNPEKNRHPRGRNSPGTWLSRVRDVSRPRSIFIPAQHPRLPLRLVSKHTKAHRAQPYLERRKVEGASDEWIHGRRAHLKNSSGTRKSDGAPGRHHPRNALNEILRIMLFT